MEKQSAQADFGHRVGAVSNCRLVILAIEIAATKARSRPAAARPGLKQSAQADFGHRVGAVSNRWLVIRAIEIAATEARSPPSRAGGLEKQSAQADFGHPVGAVSNRRPTRLGMGGIMRAPFTQLYLHAVWATWDRLHLLRGEVEQAAYAAIRAKCKELKCEVVAIGGMPDHVHLLVRLHPSVAVADLVKEVKGASSHLMTHKVQPSEFFKWQGGYGAFTVSKANVPAVQRYIERQPTHHAEQDLWEEWEQTLVEDPGD